MIDLRQVKFTTSANSFKNTGVFETSITASGTVNNGASVEFTSSITLAENQVFCYAVAEYEDFTRLDGNKWRQIPTFDLNITTTPVGVLNWYLLYTINGTNVTFRLGTFNGLGATETIPSTTINIRYVTYTLTQ